MRGYYLRTSSSIVNFREKAEKIWDIERYQWPRDIFKPAVFFGMYHIGDYLAFLKHLGPKSILWGGSDLTALINAKLPYYKLFRNADNYVENNLERKELDMYGIKAKVVPSFLEDIDNFPISYEPKDRVHVYISIHPGREEEYGVELIKRIVPHTPNAYYNIFGGTFSGFDGDHILHHGRVTNEYFNQEIKKYHCGLRINSHDGFSEVTAKSILMGQYPITRIKYSGIPSYETEEQLIKLINSLSDMKEPNIDGRDFYRQQVNVYPWVEKHTTA